MDYTTSKNERANAGGALRWLVQQTEEDGKTYTIIGNTTQAYEITPPSGRLHLVLDVDETILLKTTGRGASNKTFFGVSVIVVNP